jgi:hypothetical protein
MKNVPDDKYLHSLTLCTAVQNLEVQMETMLTAPHFSSPGCEPSQTSHSPITHKYIQSCNTAEYLMLNI